MSNTYYHFTSSFVPGTKVRSDDMNNELDGITAGFDKLPTDPTSINRGTTYVGTESGSGNVYQVARVNVQTSYQNGDHIGFFATHTNTSSGTLEADSLGAVALVAPDGSALVASDILNGVYYEAVFDTANNRWQLLSPTGGTITEADKRVSWAEEWAIKAEGDPVSVAAGGDAATTFSALHWSAKSSGFATNSSNSASNASTSETNASDWASKTGALVLATDYSAKEYAIGVFVPDGSSKQWADEVENTEVTTGKYSALHWAAKAAASAGTNNLPAIGAGDAGKGLIVNPGETGYDFDTTIAHTDKANTFTSTLRVQNSAPVFGLYETDTSDQNYDFQLNSGTLKLRKVQDGGAQIDIKISMTQDAQELALTNGDITYAGSSIRTFSGSISAIGAISDGPSGWTSARIGVGYYRVTHNLGVSPSVALTAESSGAYMCAVTHPSVNYFEYGVYFYTGTITDQSAQFIAQI